MRIRTETQAGQRDRRLSRHLAPVLIAVAILFARGPEERRSRARSCADARALRAFARRITLVDLNGAPAIELELLPGLGPGSARRAVAFREVLGPFSEPRDLSLLPGISENRWQDLRVHIAAEPP